MSRNSKISQSQEHEVTVSLRCGTVERIRLWEADLERDGVTDYGTLAEAVEWIVDLFLDEALIEQPSEEGHE